MTSSIHIYIYIYIYIHTYMYTHTHTTGHMLFLPVSSVEALLRKLCRKPRRNRYSAAHAFTDSTRHQYSQHKHAPLESGGVASPKV